MENLQRTSSDRLSHYFLWDFPQFSWSPYAFPGFSMIFPCPFKGSVTRMRLSWFLWLSGSNPIISPWTEISHSAIPRLCCLDSSWPGIINHHQSTIIPVELHCSLIPIPLKPPLWPSVIPSQSHYDPTIIPSVVPLWAINTIRASIFPPWESWCHHENHYTTINISIVII